MSRLKSPLLGLVLAASALAARPAPVAASAMPTYTFTNTTGGAISRADFAVVPTGAVKAPVIGTDPNTGLPITASPVTLNLGQSSGFDTGNFSTALGTGATLQGLRLLFGLKQSVDSQGNISFVPVAGPNGAPPRFLDPGGTVTFSLSLDPAFQGTVNLVSLTKGVPNPTLLPNPPAGGGSGGSGGGGDVPQNNIPEPVTLALWSAGLGGVALARRRRARASA